MSESVVFLNVQRSYSPGEDLVVSYQYQANSELSPSRTRRDWVGLFRVGWTSSRDYYSFEWATEPSVESRVGQVKFAGRRLPPEDGHFYQLCYVSCEGTVRGASPSLQFMGTLEMGEVGGEGLTSMVMLQHRNSGEMQRLRQDCQRTQEQLSSVQASISELHIERESLAGQLEKSEAARWTLQGEVREVQDKEARIAELERQVAVLHYSYKRLMEKLERERAQSQQLLAAKSGGESQTIVLQGQIMALREEVAALHQGSEELRQQLKMREGRVEDMQQQLKMQEAHGKDLQQQLKVREDQIGDLQLRTQEGSEEMAVQSKAFAEQLQEERGQVERLQQELSMAQENIAELMGAHEELHTPPPSAGMVERSPSAAGVVDRSVYEALQLAYENMEAYFKDSQQEKEEGRRQLAAFQEAEEALREGVAALHQGSEELRQQLKMREAQVEDLYQQLKMQEAHGKDLQQQLKVREDQIGDLQLRTQECSEEMAVQSKAFAEQLQEERGQVERLQQELSVAQDNIAELMGAREELHTPPPSAGMVERSPSAAGVVDRSVYEALQLCHENMVKDIQQEKEEGQRQLAAFQEAEEALREEVAALHQGSEELRQQLKMREARVEGLQQQLKMQEAHGKDLQQQLKVREDQIVDRKDHKELVKLPIAANWYELGIQLGVPASKLKEFQVNHPNRAQLCLDAMFDWWLKNGESPTRSQLAEALEVIDQRDLAKNFRSQSEKAVPEVRRNGRSCKPL